MGAYSKTDTIAAIATAPGRGGIGVLRISGDQLLPFALALCGKTPQPRRATIADFCHWRRFAGVISSELPGYSPGA